MLSPSLASPLTQSPSNRRQHRQRRLNFASLLEGLPGTIVTTRDSTLSKCAATCHNAAGAAVCPSWYLLIDAVIWPPPASAPMRTSVPTFYHACKVNGVQGECQAAEFDNAQQFVASLCGNGTGTPTEGDATRSLVTVTVANLGNPNINFLPVCDFRKMSRYFVGDGGHRDSDPPVRSATRRARRDRDRRLPTHPYISLTSKPTATVPFLPTNPNADINEPSHTSGSVSLSSPSLSTRNVSYSPGENITANYSRAPAQTSQETGSSNTSSTQAVDRNGVPAGAIAASLVIVFLIVVLVIFVWWIRRRRQQIRERRFPAPFLESVSPVQRVVRIPSIIKVAAAAHVETQAEVSGTTMVQGVALDETQPEKGAPPQTHNLPLINFSDVPAEVNTA
ncbi:hypothetical protein B0H11DRAFT_1933167 [Mycena galericulata]|nr:hypothetical protein B0H11DRAFT_1933167 [Mycena galericulata]